MLDPTSGDSLASGPRATVTATTIGPSRTPLLRVRGLVKSFPGTRALGGVDLDIHGGSVHALVGQNGSGKSTMIKILSGYHAPDGGTLEVRGESVRLPITTEAADAVGLRFLHQDQGLNPKFTVLETVRLRAFDSRWYERIRWRHERDIVRRLLADLGSDIDPDTQIVELTPSQRAVVAIARALQGLTERPAILVLDEPTASLNKADAERLFAAIRQLRGKGHAVLFVSHRLDEVLEIADWISVLRDGNVVRSESAVGTSEASLITAILGRDIGTLYPERHGVIGNETLQVHELDGSVVDAFSCAVHSGEIVGITGLGGMGHDEVPYLIFGAHRARHGTIMIDGRSIERASPQASIAAGIAFLPADRERTAGVRRATVAENITMGRLTRYFTRGWLRLGREQRDVAQLLRLFEVRPPDPNRMLLTLSGGNQQKALLAKWLQAAPKVLLLHEPTQGVDVGSRQQVFKLIRRAADSGSAILIASSEYAELSRFCNRVMVMRRGRIVGQLSGSALTEEGLIGACYATA